jgi:hypothetical protein
MQPFRAQECWDDGLARRTGQLQHGMERSYSEVVASRNPSLARAAVSDDRAVHHRRSDHKDTP